MCESAVECANRQRDLFLLLGEPGSTAAVTWAKPGAAGVSGERVLQAAITRNSPSPADARLIRALSSSARITLPNGGGPGRARAAETGERRRSGGGAAGGGGGSSVVGWLKSKARALGRRPAELIKGYVAPDGGDGRARSGGGAAAAAGSRSTLAGKVPHAAAAPTAAAAAARAAATGRVVAAGVGCRRHCRRCVRCVRCVRCGLLLPAAALF
jgi:hypothetical protein